MHFDLGDSTLASLCPAVSLPGQCSQISVNEPYINLYPASIYALKMSSAYYVCGIYPSALQTSFIMKVNIMNLIGVQGA